MIYTLVNDGDQCEKQAVMLAECNFWANAVSSHVAIQLIYGLNNGNPSDAFAWRDTPVVHKKSASPKPKLKANARRYVLTQVFNCIECSRQLLNMLFSAKKRGLLISSFYISSYNQEEVIIFSD